jgi:arsenical pump membrane protein
MNLAAHPPLAEALSLVLVLVILGWTVARPFGWPEAIVAVPAAAVVIGTGAISLDHAWAEATRLGPVVAFLAALLILARVCADEGLFQACGSWMSSAARGRPRRLLAAVFAAAAVVTAVLSLDTTVVMLTPVVFAIAARLGVRSRPHVYACAHLSNSASLLLPVSNLTNLLAFAASGLSFTRFAALMALPWLAAIAGEFAVFPWFFAVDLDADGPAPRTDEPPRVPVFVIVAVGATLVGFVVTSTLGVNPAWAAAGGAGLLGARALVRRRTTSTAVIRAAAIPFLLFVLALGIVVQAAVDNGVGAALAHIIPAGTTLLALLGLAVLAAALANLINNLPAVLVLLPLTAPAGASAVLAVLIGVNIGPNLTYAGSLATLLWRRIVADHNTEVEFGQFTRLGLLTVPAALILAVVALWASLHAIKA